MYYFRVSAYNVDIESPYSDSLNAVTWKLIDDWWLPNSGEMEQIDAALYPLGNFSTITDYHTSTEIDQDNSISYSFNGHETSPGLKSDIRVVRPIRMFYAAEGAYNVGDTGEGEGLVFYLDPELINDLQRVYEVLDTDLGPEIWSNLGDGDSGAIFTEIGGGFTNTEMIINQGGHTTSAAKLCVDYSVEVDPSPFEF